MSLLFPLTEAPGSTPEPAPPTPGHEVLIRMTGSDHRQALGVEHAQGYHVARPVALRDVFPLRPPPARVRR
jgi:hypothetical protein